MENEKDIAIQIEGLKKRYRLGTIGGGTLVGDLQSWWARVHGKEDPNKKIGAKIYGKNETFMALDGIDLTIYKGERIGIIGHNGAGKSTLLKLLSRVTGPTEGVIKLDGRISSMLEVGTGFNGELTGRENIYLNGAILGMTKAEVDSKIEDIIEFSEVRQFIDTPVKRYSSGMYVKLAFSVAAHLDSEIMIMDEVLAVGDMAFQKKCLDKMSQVSKDEGRTILYVSHNMNTIRQLCERCIVMDHGKIVFNGDVESAIGLYLNNGNIEQKANIDLSNFERPSVITKQAKMLSISFLDRSDCVYKKGNPIRFKIRWQANCNLKDVKLRMIVRYKDDSPVGLVQSSTLEEVKENSVQDTCFEFDTSMLSQGKYYFSIALFQSDNMGNSIMLDHITRACSIDIISHLKDKNLLAWQHRWWGSVAFPDLKIIDQG